MEGKKWKILGSALLTIALVISIGLALMNYALEAMNTSQREGLLFRAGTIALTLNPEYIQSLAGNSSDLTTENYQALKRDLIEIRSLNKDVRFVYIMGLRNGKQFFYVDSEDPSSEDYSYPGQIYTDALPEDIQNHKTGTSYTMGPYSDAWGEWVSAYAPVMTEDGTVAGMVGLDIAAEDIQLRIKGIRTIAILIMSLVSISVVSIAVLALKSEKKS